MVTRSIGSNLTTSRLFGSDIYKFVISVRLRLTADNAVVSFCCKRHTLSSWPFSVGLRVLDSAFGSLAKKSELSATNSFFSLLSKSWFMSSRSSGLSSLFASV